MKKVYKKPEAKVVEIDTWALCAISVQAMGDSDLPVVVDEFKDTF